MGAPLEPVEAPYSLLDKIHLMLSRCCRKADDAAEPSGAHRLQQDSALWFSDTPALRRRCRPAPKLTTCARPTE
eukprot:scaffold35234_cov28-Tisochrysis_lutea.AAC.3